jgi:hypothetical protein
MIFCCSHHKQDSQKSVKLVDSSHNVCDIIFQILANECKEKSIIEVSNERDTEENI